MSTFDKLVRDNIPNILRAKGISYTQRVASPDEFKKRLIEKLMEEVEEFLQSETSEELADIIEVIETLKTLSPYTTVDAVRQTKLKERG